MFEKRLLRHWPVRNCEQVCRFYRRPQHVMLSCGIDKGAECRKLAVTFDGAMTPSTNVVGDAMNFTYSWVVYTTDASRLCSRSNQTLVSRIVVVQRAGD